VYAKPLETAASERISSRLSIRFVFVKVRLFAIDFLRGVSEVEKKVDIPII
jgi:hypothetical protein